VRDELFRTKEDVRDFVFDQSVAGVFDDMLNRSVPFYRETQRMAVELGTQFLESGGTVYDVGCSTGNTLVGFLKAVPADQPVRFVGLEPSPSMRQRVTEKLAALGGDERVTVLPDPIESFERLEDARVILMLYTLQFVRPLFRGRVLRMCQESLTPGGCLILAEKILADNSALSRLYIDLYHDYKRRAGYSGDEVVRKREALENVLVPYRDSENLAMLAEAGFSVVDHVFRWYNFTVYLALKD
jgi:tRNA (cmo5U34)-methyltransferase